VSGSYTVKVRRRGGTERERHDKRGDALAAVERIGRELEREADGRPEGGGLMRKIDPAKQVVGRIEISGPARPGRLRAGVDVRGDGSSEAFTGRVRREIVKQRGGESAFEALRRVVKSAT
jgi:hypothetical protein